MPRRAVTRASPVASVSEPTSPPSVPNSDDAYHANLRSLRHCWKWAVFSQFFFTFAPVFAMHEVSISDIEDDLAHSTRIYLPRVMQRLLYALTQDRKISLDNWQSALRKQYARRDPAANPIGFEPKKVHLKYSLEPIEPDEIKDEPLAPSLDTPIANSTIPPEGTAELDRQRSSPLLAQSDNDDAIHNDNPRPSSPDVPQSETGEPQPDELKDWLSLPMLTKLDSLHLLTEWQFHNSNRIRSIMKDDDEGAQWRIEPIGYDAQSNAYWFIGADRLWIQRHAHKSRSLKRKRAPAAATANKRKQKSAPVNGRGRKAAGKRRRIETSDDESDTDDFIAAPLPPKPPNGRAAKANAKNKLDAQAKALAEFQRQNAATTRNNRSSKLQRMDDEDGDFSAAKKTFGTRLSKRLRSSVNRDDEWQQIPDGWLGDEDEKYVRAINDVDADASERDGSPEPTPKKSIAKTGLESDLESISDLTELSDSSAKEESEKDEDTSESEDEDEEEEEKEEERKPLSPIPEDFVEWEMICSTREEWEHIAERFENAAHYAEKALYKLLTKHIVPAVIEDFEELERVKQETEKKKYVEEAVVTRKRSSRIAIKESEREEARKVAQRKAEEMENMTRAKRLEMRLKREETERAKKERAKEQKMIEQEEGLRRAEANGSMSPSREVSTSATRISRRSQITGDWELDCEVCFKSGVNLDDGVPLMCCGSCKKWQHVHCHETADRMAGRAPRNWGAEGFFCAHCRSYRNRLSTQVQYPDQPYYPSNYPPSKVKLRWDHERMARKLSLPTSHPPASVDPRMHRVRQDIHVPLPVNGSGSFHQPISNGHYMNPTPPPLLSPPRVNPYSNIAFSHHQPQHRDLSQSGSVHGIPPPPQLQEHQHQQPQFPHLPLLSPQSILPLPQQQSHHVQPDLYSSYNNISVPPSQGYGGAYDDGFHQLSAIQNEHDVGGSSWDRSLTHGFVDNSGMSFSGTGLSMTQDPRLYNQHQQPTHQQLLPHQELQQQWGYEQTNHLNLNGATRTSMDYGM